MHTLLLSSFYILMAQIHTSHGFLLGGTRLLVDQRCNPIVVTNRHDGDTPMKSLAASRRDNNNPRQNNHPGDGNDDDDSILLSSVYNADTNTWRLANDFLTFLNQVSIQSFLFVLASLRDPHTIRWMDTFTQPVYPDEVSSSSSSPQEESEHDNNNDKQPKRKKSVRLTGTTAATLAITSNPSVANPNGKSSTRLLIYHGLACLNTTTRFAQWDAYFRQLLAMPRETLVIQSQTGWAADYELEINPASLCARLLSVREQIAREFAHDLGVVAHSLGRSTMDGYWDFMDDNDDDDDNDEKGDFEASGATSRSTANPETITMSSGADVERRLPPHNLVFLDYSLDGSGDMAPSPLRKGNFDLVVLLATQESIHRILNNQQQEDLGREQSKYQAFLRDFYTKRVESHFTGIQRYGRADDFLEELLFYSPSSSRANNGLSFYVDTVRLAEIILNERQQVALEWQAMSQDVPNDHIVIRRLQLNKLLESYSS